MSTWHEVTDETIKEVEKIFAENEVVAYGELEMKEGYDTDEMAFDELVQLSNHYNAKASDEFHKGDNAKAAYYLCVAERYQADLKNRVILSAI